MSSVQSSFSLLFEVTPESLVHSSMTLFRYTGPRGEIQVYNRRNDRAENHPNNALEVFLNVPDSRGRQRHHRYPVWWSEPHDGPTPSSPRRVFNPNEKTKILITLDKDTLDIFQEGRHILNQHIPQKGNHWGDATTMIVGAYKLNPKHHEHHRTWNGEIKNIRFWPAKKLWAEAVVGRIMDDQDDAQQDKNDAGKSLASNCIASTKSNYDFFCGSRSEMSSATEEAFGLESFVRFDSLTLKDFDSREIKGEVTRCGDHLRAKSGIFHRKFGDGLTGEYFRVPVNCHGTPFLFGKKPTLVRIDPQINYTGGFLSAHHQYAIRWSGKILIIKSGTYQFCAKHQDSLWIAIDQNLDYAQKHCNRLTNKCVTRQLEKGARTIAVLYQNYGENPKVELKYSGPDTNGNSIPIPQSNLASAPLKLSRLEEEQKNETGEANSTSSVNNSAGKNTTSPENLPGRMTWTEDFIAKGAGAAVMPRGSCDTDCRNGLRKDGAAPFNFFCKKKTNVSFRVHASTNVDRALLWIDNDPYHSWELRTRNQPQLILTDAILDDEKNGDSDDLKLKLSLGIDQADEECANLQYSDVSENFLVEAGSHRLRFQLTPSETQCAAMTSLRIGNGSPNCEFFLEGTDKLKEDC